MLRLDDIYRECAEEFTSSLSAGYAMPAFIITLSGSLIGLPVVNAGVIDFRVLMHFSDEKMIMHAHAQPDRAAAIYYNASAQSTE